jgi:predicted RNase H-like nuclease (RuvC/YqgF family)
MNINYKEQIDHIIETALTEKTFTFEIIDEIKKLKELPPIVEELNKKVNELNSEKEQLKSELDTLKLMTESVKKREQDVLVKERTLELKEVENIWKDNLLNEYKNMMSLVFRNTTIRENKFGTVPVERNGYVESASTNENTDRTAE